MNCKLTIKLKSDTCIALGASSGRSIDSDVYTNEYGFPFIPSKRLKGVIKDACKEYNLFINDILNIDKLFGTRDDTEGTLKICNAELSEFISEKDDVISDIFSHNINPKSVKRMYISKRTQTAIDAETGTAKESSLRTINVVNKGLVFISSINNVDDNDFEALKDAIKLVRHIGLNRNRGLGFVSCHLEKDNEIEEKLMFPSCDFDYLELRIHNVKPLLISSSLKNETLNYIMGSSIYGFFANEYAKKIGLGRNEVDPTFTELFLRDKVIFTNAYISDDEFNEYVPVPRFIQKEKNKNAEGKNNYINLLSNKNHDDKKKASLSNKYIKLLDLVDSSGLPLNDLHIIEPNIENNYHHSLDDKGIVNEFYSYESICANQNFVSRIYGDKELLKELFSKVDSKTAYFGKSKNSQYGECVISIVGKKNENVKDGDIIVFTSPCQLRNSEGELSLTIDEVLKNGNIEAKNTKKYSLSYMTLGGYNMQWNLPKPQRTVISQESYIEGSVSDDVEFLGDDISVGCGQFIKINKARLCQDNTKVTKEVSPKIKEGYFKSNWAKTGKYFKLCEDDRIISEAYAYYKNVEKKSKLNSHQIERILKMISEFDDFKTFEINVDEIADSGYRDNVKVLIENCKCGKYPLFFKTLFTLLKYAKR